MIARSHNISFMLAIGLFFAFGISILEAQMPVPKKMVIKVTPDKVVGNWITKTLLETTTASQDKLWKVGDEVKEVGPRRSYDRNERVLANQKTARDKRAQASQMRRSVPAYSSDLLINLQKIRDMSNKAAKIEIGAPTRNFDGQGFTGVHPPDACGDVGKKYFIQAVNDGNGTRFTVYHKERPAGVDTDIAAGPFLLSQLGAPGTEGAGDPIVLYDHLAERWFLAEFAPQAVNELHVYISKTDDPINGGWFHYRFPTPNFPDYPKFGIWPDAYYVTTNESEGPAVYVLQREKMLSGEAADFARFVAGELDGFGFQALTPCDVDGPAPPGEEPFCLMRHRDDESHHPNSNDESSDFLELFEATVAWPTGGGGEAALTVNGPIQIPFAEFDSELNGLASFECFPQPQTSTTLDPLREVIMHRLQYRNFGSHQSLVGSFVTDVDNSDHGGIRWFELRKISTQDWMVFQQGTFAPDSNDRWMSSIAMDGEGNIAVGYNITSRTVFPGLRFAGRHHTESPGTLPQGEYNLIEGTGSNQANRYGDYSSMSVDPVDDRTFWFTGEYNNATNWATRIGAFRFPN